MYDNTNPFQVSVNDILRMEVPQPLSQSSRLERWVTSIVCHNEISTHNVPPIDVMVTFEIRDEIPRWAVGVQKGREWTEFTGYTQEGQHVLMAESIPDLRLKSESL